MAITPEQINRVLARISGNQPIFQIIVERIDGQDQMTVMIEISDLNFFDEMKKQRRFADQLHRELSELIGWEVVVRLVEPGTFNPEEKVVDKRQFQ
jgi:phenylacetate-coenzyme A ligase PaaK-like adenylate-forming protein